MAVLNDPIEDIYAMNVQIERLNDEIAALRAKRAKTIDALRRQIDQIESGLEQIELAERHANGDATVVRDPACGNGAGGYRVVIKGRDPLC